MPSTFVFPQLLLLLEGEGQMTKKYAIGKKKKRAIRGYET